MKAVIFVGVLAVGVGVLFWYGSMKEPPTIPKQFVSPDAPPQYPTALDAPLYRDPPAAETIDSNLPPSSSSVCSIQSRADWLGQGLPIDANANDEDFAVVLTGAKAQAGCFAPPT